MFQRKTQTTEYWGSEFRFTEEDLIHLSEMVLDKGRPCRIGELALAFIDFRRRQEDAQIREELTKGTLYQPRQEFDVGQRLVFPAFDFAAGSVVAERAGMNPEHGEFNVVAVQFDGERKPREFAAGLETPHALNLDDGGESLLQADDQMSTADLKAGLASDLDRRLAEYLADGWGDTFVQTEGQWFLRAMLVDVNVGHLNIAEALVEMASEPMSTGQLLAEFELPSEVAPEVLAFSVSHALEQDDRFDDIGTAGKRLWYLRRLEPEAAVQVPEPLRYVAQDYDRLSLTPGLLRLEWELGDEWTEQPGESLTVSPSVTLVLTYPHRQAGTLPLSFRNSGLFPSGDAARTMVTLIDGRWGQRFSGWAVHDGRYIVGLEQWFDQHKVPVGAYIVMQRGPEPGEVMVDFRPRRMRREWARIARVDRGQLVFEMRKTPIACEYDDLMVVDALDSEEVLDLRQSMMQAGAPLSEVLEQVFLELLKLSPEGTVHAKTAYGAVNLVRRLPPGPVFSALLSDERYQSEGDGFWSLA